MGVALFSRKGLRALRIPALGGPGRFLHRLRAPASPGEVERVETVLARARVFLAVSALVAISLDPTAPSRYAALVYALLILFLIHSLLILIVSVPAKYANQVAWFASVVDIIWCASITLFTEGPNSPFFLFFVFVLVAAAYRWGFTETLLTTGFCILLLSLEAIFLAVAPDTVLTGDFSPNRLIMRSAYLLMMGFMLGYLAEEEKLLRAESAVVTRLLKNAQVETGLRGTLRSIFDEVLQIFNTERTFIALQERHTGRVFLWMGQRGTEGQETTVTLTEVEETLQNTYFFPTIAESWHAVRAADGHDEVVALDADGHRLRAVEPGFLDPFWAVHDVRSVLGVSFDFREEWRVRYYVLDPYLGDSPEKELRFALNLLRQGVPAVYDVYLLGRLRTQIGAKERARVAREMHDGAIQSLTAVEMKMDVLRRKAAIQEPAIGEDLSRLQQLLRREIVGLRELMEQIRPIQLDPERLPETVEEMVGKFRRETGIQARFVSDLEEVKLSPRTCTEIVRIVQEALVNVRKHSGAKQVSVQLSVHEGHTKLVIQDDGQGFDSVEQLSRQESEGGRRGPLVIKDRVRSIGGMLSVISQPGRGTRLEITVLPPADRKA